MLDAQAFAGMLQSFQAITNIAKSLIGMHDVAVIRERVSKLQAEILSAQTSALAFQTEYAKTFERIRELEKEVADLKAWDVEKQRYELGGLRPQDRVLGPLSEPRVFGYTPKGEANPSYALCPNCFEDRVKSVLQKERRTPGMAEVLFCHRCGLDLYLEGEREPEHRRLKTPQER
jgi:hypothetical protein